MRNTLTKEQIEDLIIYLGSKPTIWRGNDMLICCPVHGETHPSCGISADKQIFHCFSCGASGNFSKLLYLSLPDDFGYDDSTPESAKKTWFRASKKARAFLKDRYELEYRELSDRKVYVKRFDDLQKSIITLDERQIIPLWKIAPFMSGKQTYQYFFNRGFDKSDMQKFKIGYDDINKTVTIPVFYEDNKLAGVIGRYISKNRRKNERYKIYDHFERSNLLYPMNFYQPINDTMIIVEGQFDAIRCHKSGFTNVQAIMTDNMSDKQVELVLKMCSRVIYIGDNDERGLEAREKNYKKLKGKIDFLIVDFPDHGKDPCDWTDEELQTMINNAHSVIHRKIRRV